MTQLEFIRVEQQGRLAVVTLNQPAKRNALNYAFVRELRDIFALLLQDPNLKVVILRAEGEVFSAGGDMAYLKKLQDFTVEENIFDAQHLAELYQLIYQYPRVVIAEVRGAAYSSGLGLAVACDFVFASEDARFAATEARYGFTPAAYLPLLLRKIGEQNARRMLFNPEKISAEEAREMGLVYKIYPPAELSLKVNEFADSLCSRVSGGAIELTKRLLSDLQDIPLNDAFKITAKMNGYARKTQEAQAGILSYLDKQPLDWK